MNTFAKRLKEARLRAGLSQEQLGIEAGLEPASASARMNRYELGKRFPDIALIEILAQVLRVSPSYFFSIRDEEANFLIQYGRLSKIDRNLVHEYVGKLLEK